MTIEKMYSLRKAAKVIGISHGTLRIWLEIDLGLRMPKVERGSKILVTERDIEAVIKKHSPQLDWNLFRRGVRK